MRYAYNTIPSYRIAGACSGKLHCAGQVLRVSVVLSHKRESERAKQSDNLNLSSYARDASKFDSALNLFPLRSLFVALLQHAL